MNLLVLPQFDTIPLSLYIHFPWCIKKCPYCDFNSHTLKEDLPEAAYVEILCQHLIQSLPWINNRLIHSIFLGGGTPSLFSAQALSPLFDCIAQHCRLTSNIEITLEANPSTVEQARFKNYRALGINRISLGVQSFQNKYLQRLGRVHDAQEAQSAIKTVIEAGFERFNCDLMFGLPEQPLCDALKDLNTALSFSPPHISWYELTLEPNTPFAHHPPALPCSDIIADMQTAGQSLLSTAGFNQYEVSAYTREQPCHHNVNYWTFGDYIAIGAGGHGKITLDAQTIMRYQHVKHPKQYMAPERSLFSESQILTADQLPFEYFLNTLRLCNGAPTSLFYERTGLPLSTIQSKLEILMQKGWIEPFDNVIKTTPLGFRFLNDVTGSFLIS